MGRRPKESTDMEKLTIEVLPQLVGKKIEIMYFSMNGPVHDEIVVGGVMSRYDIAKKDDMGNGTTRAQMWDRCLTPKKLEATKVTMCLIDAKGNDTFIFAKNNHFWCKDELRQVYYTVID